MKVFKAMATINDQGQIKLDSPLLSNKNSRVEIIVLIPESAEDFTKEEIISDFRQAWHEAMTGQTIPLSQLWEGIEND
jgi:hypothetical protein